MLLKHKLAAVLAGALVFALPVLNAADALPGRVGPVQEVTDDASVSSQVRGELARDKVLAAASIRVDTTKGVVRLAGDVPSKSDAERAGEIARRVSPVAKIQNDLRATGTAKK